MSFVPYEKLSKKAKKEVDAKQRKIWLLKPVTKKVESKKKDSRKGLDFSYYITYHKKSQVPYENISF